MKNILLTLTAGILIGLLFSAVILLIATPFQGSPVQLLPTETRTPYKVQVSGAVINSGVYQFNAGDRVEDAIQMAGGTLPDADLSTLNLALRIYDGQKIYVPSIGETPQILLDEKSQELIELVDINTATAEQLEDLPGIGPSKAEEIVRFRQINGLFDTIEDIQNVPGIGPSIFEQIQELIVVSPPS